MSSIEIKEDDKVVVGNLYNEEYMEEEKLVYRSEIKIEGFVLNSDGTYRFDPSHSVYQSLSEGEIKRLTVPIKLYDEDNELLDEFDFDLTIIGTNDDPTVKVKSERVEIKDVLESSGQIEAKDIDSQHFSYEVLTDAKYGTFSIDNGGAWHYDVDRTYKGGDEVKIAVSDDAGGSVEKTIHLNIANNPTNGDKFSNDLLGSDVNDILNGQRGNDKLYAYGGDDMLFGDEGEDRLYGLNGSDKLSSGEGRDYMSGGQGEDYYYFNRGDGQDTIYDRSLGRGEERDRLIFGDTITEKDLSFERDGDDLSIHLGGEDSINIRHYYLDKNYEIEDVSFSDGSVISMDTLIKRENPIVEKSDNYLSHSDMERIIQEISAFQVERDFDMNFNQTVDDNAKVLQILTPNHQL